VTGSPHGATIPAAPNPLRAFAATRPGDVEVEQVDVVAAQRGRAGQQFLDRHGEPLPW